MLNAPILIDEHCAYVGGMRRLESHSLGACDALHCRSPLSKSQ
jgi:hypothetical protein